MTTFKEETDTLKIMVEDPEKDEDQNLRARVHAKPQGHEMNSYDERIKFSGRSAQSYANTVQDVFDCGDDLVNELKKEILKLKNKVRNEAEPENDYDQDGESQRSQEDKRQKLFKIMEQIMKAGDSIEQEAVEETLGLENVWDIVDDVDIDAEYIIPDGDDSIRLTDEGRSELKQHLGFETFDGDPQAEAQRQLESNNPLRYYLDAFNKIHKGDHLLKCWEMISALSSKCADRQIHSWAVGPSGTGKSHLKRKLLEFLPNKMYKRKESFSPKALQYKSKTEGPSFMNNKLIYFDEVGEEDVDNAIELMRLMTDQDQDIVTHETVKDQEIMTITLDVSNITVWFTSVVAIQDEQLKNRFILTNPDSSSAQNETVNMHQQNILNSGGSLDFIPKETPVIQAMVQDIREETPGYRPVVPFMIDWKQEFNRRLYPFFYTLMGMIAKIHIRNRVTKDGFIFVTRADFDLARLIWSRLIDTTVAQTDEKSISLLKELPNSQTASLSRKELRNRLTGFTTQDIKDTADSLMETEELQLINSEYIEGEVYYWAGADVEQLVDNVPEIMGELTDEKIESQCREAGVEPTQEIRDSIYNAEIPVIDFLRDSLGEDTETEPPELTEEEVYFLRTLEQMEWGITIDSARDFFETDTETPDADIHEIVESLEDKEVIEVDGENKPSPLPMYDRLNSQGAMEI
jgi:hypothetical protein